MVLKLKICILTDNRDSDFMAKHYITIEDDLYEDIVNYCKLNNLKINSYCCNLLRKEHNMSKYGDIPFGIIGGNDDIVENLPESGTSSSDYDTAVNTNETVNDIVIETKPEIKEEQEIVTEEIIKPKKRRL